MREKGKGEESSHLHLQLLENGPRGINLPVFINANISGVIGRAALMRTGGGCCPPPPAIHLLLFVLLTTLHLFQGGLCPPLTSQQTSLPRSPCSLPRQLPHSFLPPPPPPLAQPIPRPREGPGLSLIDCRPGAGPFAARRPWFPIWERTHRRVLSTLPVGTSPLLIVMTLVSFLPACTMALGHIEMPPLPRSSFNYKNIYSLKKNSIRKQQSSRTPPAVVHWVGRE